MPRPGPRPFECVRRSWHSDRHQPLRGSIIQQIFRVVHENHSPATKKNREWQEKLAVVVLKSEEILYSKANSEMSLEIEAEYLDPETLWDRLNDAIDTIIRKDETMETGEFLHPCVEAALNLGCVPVRSSRSQRNTNTMSYLSPRNQGSSPVVQNAPNVRRPPDGASQTHTFSDTNKDSNPSYNVTPAGSSFYPHNVPRQMMSLEDRSSSVYPLYHGFHFQPQMGYDNAQLNRNNIILGTPVFQAAHESLPSASQTGRQDRSLLFDKDANCSRPELVECDLSLRLGLVSSNEKGLTFGDDVDSGQRSKEFSFFPLNTEVKEGESLMTDVRKRKTVGESQSFLRLERDFDRIKDRVKRQGL